MAFYEVVSGSVIGYDHVRRGAMFIGGNNQDASATLSEPGLRDVIGVVCDGCGSEPRSELGAAFTANIVIDNIVKLLIRREAENFWQRVEWGILDDLRQLATLYKKEPREELLLTTIVGFLITDEETTVFHIGDGYFGVNGEIEQIESPIENTPPYLAYQLIGVNDEADAKFVEALGAWPYSFQVRTWPTSSVRDIFVATDGMRYLIEHEGQPMPAKPSQLVPSVSNLLADDTIYLNPFRLGHILTAINSDGVTLASGRAKRVPGLLLDDTTIVAARRKPDAVDLSVSEG